MKKTIILVILAIITLVLCNNKNKDIAIPKESIRIRIIANSNSDIDIVEKMNIKEKIEKEVYQLLENVKSIEEARKIISENMDNLNVILEDETYNYNINFGRNYFPKKIYKNIIYEEGNYESLVITIGEGKGHNWWCVLFPPLCLLEDNDNTNDIEYSFFVKEILDNYNDK